MQHARACRRCITEDVGESALQKRTYASTLFNAGDLRVSVEEIEHRRAPVPFVCFFCSDCLRYSVFSYSFHMDVMGTKAYATKEEYYTSLVAQHKHPATN